MEHLPHKPTTVALVVQSDILRRLRVAGSLRRAGFEVYETADANEAIRVLNSFVVDVLFSDIDLYGEIDGVELAAWVCQHQPNASVVLTHEDRPHPGRPLSH